MENKSVYENKELTPLEYFNILKSKKERITNSDLDKIYDNCMSLMQKYIRTGQVNGARKLMFHLETIEKEKELVKQGIDTFIYKDDIEYFIDKVADESVKIIELEAYERTIPDNIIDLIEINKNRFDRLYVLFTDYTGTYEREIQRERREKDPILFGVFLNDGAKSIVDRFYFIGDWEDEYCDLTLDKMVGKMKDIDILIERNISTPQSIGELKEQLELLREEKDKGYKMLYNQKKKEGFFKSMIGAIANKRR